MLGNIKKVVCGISGGVDSAVAALLLKQKGYAVEGVYMKNWDVSEEAGRCTGAEDIEEARYVCTRLNIPFHTVNFVKQYWNDVFSYLIEDYQSGRTPNPDIFCNKYIKFDAFLNYALEKLNADAIATGHYAQTSWDDTIDRGRSKGVKLLQAVDQVKDQTFFLSQISQHALQNVLFPLGKLTKNTVKTIAVGAGLEKIARKKESMGICFIGSRNFHKFIEEYIEPTPGDFIDVEDGKIIGSHKGLHYWTLGQRSLVAGLKKPYCIVEKNSQTQDIIVAPGTDHPALFTESFETESPHWICEPPPELRDNKLFHAEFRFQHKHPLIKCTATLIGSNGLSVHLSRPMRAITPGQFAVFYRDEECLGSAIITQPGPSLYCLDQRDRVSLPNEFT